MKKIKKRILWGIYVAIIFGLLATFFIIIINDKDFNWLNTILAIAGIGGVIGYIMSWGCD